MENPQSMTVSPAKSGSTGAERPAPYRSPARSAVIELRELIHDSGRDVPSDRQFDRQLDLLTTSKAVSSGLPVFFAGDPGLLRAPSVSIVGTRDVSEAGRARAARLARDLVQAGVTVVSGLAKGVDTAALTSAITHNGRVAAVIGTPLNKAYPAENARLQETIWEHHLLLSPFREGEVVFRSNFPKRNRVMAALSDATVIVEASDTSGTLHQAVECQRLGRWLFIMRSVVDDPSLTWPSAFLGKPKTTVLERSDDVLAAITK
jgi:DNA processing protein